MMVCPANFINHSRASFTNYRKRLDIQEALSRQTKVVAFQFTVSKFPQHLSQAKATLRVFVSNTAVASDDGPSAWTLKVEGRLLDVCLIIRTDYCVGIIEMVI